MVFLVVYPRGSATGVTDGCSNTSETRNLEHKNRYKPVSHQTVRYFENGIKYVNSVGMT